MEFVVLSRDELKNNFECLKDHIIISICDPEGKYLEIKKTYELLGILRLRFPDFDKELEGYKYNHLLFNKCMAKNILKFVKICRDKTEVVVCQCEAGISRSAGVAAALSKIYNDNDNAYFKKYLPNMLVYKTILEVANESSN